MLTISLTQTGIHSRIPSTNNARLIFNMKPTNKIDQPDDGWKMISGMIGLGDRSHGRVKIGHDAFTKQWVAVQIKILVTGIDQRELSRCLEERHLAQSIEGRFG